MAPRSPCPIHGLLEIVGDRWTLLILRDLMFRGKNRYSEFQASSEGIATNILSVRLSMLETEGIVRKLPDPKDGRRQIYRLTERGISLAPVLVEMTVWGENNLPDTNIVPGLQEQLKTDRDGALDRLMQDLRRQGADQNV